MFQTEQIDYISSENGGCFPVFCVRHLFYASCDSAAKYFEGRCTHKISQVKVKVPEYVRIYPVTNVPHQCKPFRLTVLRERQPCTISQFSGDAMKIIV